ncbi:hypothetical protein DPMN_175201 [Dreissena polymorpha]|uniref:Uncharacterized protein n=1 Tax=Dreissena polymorpha TaxID=45954 RepID=A0A9D4E7E9_DREPO|nr:hypothetical protein DPMN_175201 [Dreissena polymorpha]
MYTALKVETAKSEGELDITALKLLQKSVPKDTRLKDSRGMFVQSKLIDFKRVQEYYVNLWLHGESIFAWTGSSADRPSIGGITVPVLSRRTYQPKYVVIQNENDEYADQGAVGPAVAE